VVEECSDGSLLMLLRTFQGSLWESRSHDGGVTWREAGPTALYSPLSPPSLKRIPSTGDLLLLWNDYAHVPAEERRSQRTPLNVAISRDNGVSWEPSKSIEDDPQGTYSYGAIEFVGEDVVLAYGASDARVEQGAGMQVCVFPVSWLYE
jgi:predicted neuraminidase